MVSNLSLGNELNVNNLSVPSYERIVRRYLSYGGAYVRTGQVEQIII